MQIVATSACVRDVAFFSDWRSAAELARPGDVVISDPPYLGGFDAYTAARLSSAQHECLAAELERLAANGCLVLAFNSPAAEPLYSRWAHLEWAYRSGRINCQGHARDRVREFVAYASRSGSPPIRCGAGDVGTASSTILSPISPPTGANPEGARQTVSTRS